MSCSNFELYVESDDVKSLDHAVQIAFTQHAKATHFERFEVEAEENKGNRHKGLPTLVFYWSDPKRSTSHPLPFDMGPEMVSSLIKEFLRNAGLDKVPQPDLDGSVKASAFVLTANQFDIWSYRLLSVSKTWAEYHK